MYERSVCPWNLILFKNKFMKTLKNLALLCIALILLLSPVAVSASAFGMGRSAAFVVAPNIRADSQRIADLERDVADAKGSADNAWMLVSSALVLLMTGPGLALF